jgi:hypothetical protein
MEQLFTEFLKALGQYVLAPLAVKWLEARLKSQHKNRRKR